jgi:Sulfotransferase domain
MNSMKQLLDSYAKVSATKKRVRDEHELDSHQNDPENGNRKPRNPVSSAKGTNDINSSSSSSVEEYEGPPHFLIIGAQKAGTMAAVKNLNKHPEIACLSEEHYFDLGWNSKTVSSYRSLFKKHQNTEKRVFGDKTPEYGYVEECHSRIRSVCSPNTKFIFMIRDPVLRAYSAWNMNVKRNFTTIPFDEYVDTNLKDYSSYGAKEYRSYGTAEHHYVQRGFYLDQIMRFLETFPDRCSSLDKYSNNDDII